MASTKQNDAPKSVPADMVKGHGLTLSNSKLESYSGIADENDRNSNLSPSKSVDPGRKKTFKITSVKKGATGSGDVGGDNDADSIDGLDESQTEDLSSEFYDSSKATDLDMDLQDCMNTPLTPDELTSTTTIVVKQKPDQNSQSRFKVVKIETKEPFRRGKWVCYDFFDTAPAAMVTVEKNDSRITDDSIIQSALAGNQSAAGLVHYVQDVNDSSSIFIPPVHIPVSPTRTGGHPMLSDVFVPIQPAPASQVLSQLDGLTSDAMTPFIAQQVLMSVASVPSTSTSFHNLVQPGHSSMIQNMPHTGLFSYPQSGSHVSLFQNGLPGQSSQMINLPSDTMLGVGGTVPPGIIAPPVSITGDDLIHSQATLGISGVPHSLSQTKITSDLFGPPGVHLPAEAGHSSAARPGVPAPMSGVQQTRLETAVIPIATDAGDHMGLAMDKSTDSIKTLQGSSDGQTSEGLKEAVEAVGEMYMGLDDADERNSEVATLFSNLHQRANQLPLMLDRRTSESPPYGHHPMRSPCTSPLPPTFLEHHEFPPGILAVRAVTPSFPGYSPMPNFFEPVPGTPGPVAFQHTDSYMGTPYFPSPPSPVFPPISPFAPFGVSEVSSPSGLMPRSFVTPPCRPCSMTSIQVPETSLTRSVSAAHLSPESAAFMTSSSKSKPRSMTSIPVPETSLARSMSAAHLSPESAAFMSSSSKSKPCSMTSIPLPGASVARSMSTSHLSPASAGFMSDTMPGPKSKPVIPTPASSLTRSLSVAQLSPASAFHSMSPADLAPECRNMSATSIPAVSISRSMSPVAFAVGNHGTPSAFEARSFSPLPPSFDTHSFSPFPTSFDTHSFSPFPTSFDARSFSPLPFTFDTHSFSPLPPGFDVRSFSPLPPDFESRDMPSVPPVSVSTSMSMTFLPSASMYSNTPMSGAFPFTVSQSMLGQHVSPPYAPFQSLSSPLTCFTDQARRQSSVSSEGSPSPVFSPLHPLPSFAPSPSMESPGISPIDVPVKVKSRQPAAQTLKTNIGQSVSNILGGSAQSPVPDKQPSESNGYVLCLIQMHMIDVTTLGVAQVLWCDSIPTRSMGLCGVYLFYITSVHPSLLTFTCNSPFCYYFQPAIVFTFEVTDRISTANFHRQA